MRFISEPVPPVTCCTVSEGAFFLTTLSAVSMVSVLLDEYSTTVCACAAAATRLAAASVHCSKVLIFMRVLSWVDYLVEKRLMRNTLMAMTMGSTMTLTRAAP